MGSWRQVTSPSKFWPRMIVLVDMNAFFASVEQRDNPAFRGRPVAVTNGMTGTCIITSSYEARAYGIRTGMRMKEARQRCPELIHCPARPQRYAEVSTRIMDAMLEVTPDVEVFSVDEAFLDVTRCQKLWGRPENIARLVKRKVYEASGIPCSVGISGDKTTAKYAAKLHKPNGLTLIAPWDAKARLHDVPVTELCGIAEGIGNFLARYGVYKCGDITRIPISVLGKRFGNPGRRIWYMCQGADPELVQMHVPPPKSIGHGKVMPPNTKDKDILYLYLLHMSEKVATRLRRHDLEATQFFIGLRATYGWVGDKLRTKFPTHDPQAIMTLCKNVLSQYWQGEGIHQVQITALNPTAVNYQVDMFREFDDKRESVHHAIDGVNQRYGEFTVAPARLLNRSSMPNVIAPAWKPYGHRKTSI